MKYCNHCNNAIEDNAAFCSFCGAAADVPPVNPQPAAVQKSDRELEEECLHTLYSRLCTERKIWRIFAFVFLGFTVFFMLFGIFFAALGETFGVALSVVYFVYGLILFLPICIINFVVVSKLGYYVDSYYVDVGPTIERSGSAGAIV